MNVVFIQRCFRFTAWKGTLNSISYVGKQKPASQCTYQHKVRAHKYKWWHWSHSITSRWTTPSRTPICEEKHYKSLRGNIRTLLKFQPFAHAGKLFFLTKWQVLSHDGDAWLWKPLMRGCTVPGALGCDSCMLKGLLRLKCNQKTHLKNGYLAGIWRDEIIRRI